MKKDKKREKKEEGSSALGVAARWLVVLCAQLAKATLEVLWTVTLYPCTSLLGSSSTFEAPTKSKKETCLVSQEF